MYRESAGDANIPFLLEALVFIGAGDCLVEIE
ncbi:hypothetical protein DN41_3274 [Vibrio cholerae]|nr:hypothetical protein DN41_3274 [Vibrio cholerae]